MSSSYPFPGTPFDGYGGLGFYGGLVNYGSLNLTVASPPQNFVEPLTIDEMVSYLRLNPNQEDEEETDHLTSLISGAREQAEILQNCDLVLKQWDLSYDYWPSYMITTRTPLVSVDLAQYTDSTNSTTTMVQNTDFIVDIKKQPGIIVPPYNGNWPTFTPWPSSAILFRYTSGYANADPFWSDAGARLKNGMRLLISDWYNNRLPFELGAAATQEYPFGVMSCLSYGAQARAR